MPAYANPYADQDSWLNLWYQNVGTGKTPPSYGQWWSMVPDFARESIEKEPSVGYGAFSTITGYGMPHTYKNWINNQYERLSNQYRALGAVDPTLWWMDYLGTLNPQREYQMSMPYERGERPGIFAPTNRMVR